jgi:hypothetical protein
MAYKKRPFRVDYFDTPEMIEGDMALVRSVVVRAVTIAQATNMVLWNDLLASGMSGGYVEGRYVIKAYRFYKTLGEQKKKVYKSIESLYGEKKALKIMDQIEAFRTKTTGTPLVPVADNTTAAKLDSPAAVPISGPSSPATQAVLTDLAGMTTHDAHEQTMDTFQPETARLPENLVNKLDALNHAADSGDDIAQAILANEPLPAPTAVEVCTDPACNVPYGEHIHVDEKPFKPLSTGLPMYEWCPKHPGHYKLNCTACKIEAAGGIENLKDQEAEKEANQDYILTATSPSAEWKESLPLPTWAKLAIFSGIAALVLLVILAILGHPCHQ